MLESLDTPVLLGPSTGPAGTSSANDAFHGELATPTLTPDTEAVEGAPSVTLDVRPAPTLDGTEAAAMEALEEANMSTYPRYGVPFSALYFQSFDKVVFRQIDKGKLVAFAIADAAHPRFSRVVMHELHVDPHHRRCKHATTLVVAIDSGLPAGGWIEAHAHGDTSLLRRAQLPVALTVSRDGSVAASKV